jgi:hypothetical protein
MPGADGCGPQRDRSHRNPPQPARRCRRA